MKISFEGRRVLITGGGRGLGRTLVEKFTECGATVFALDVDNNLLEELKKSVPNVVTICVDLSNWDATLQAVEKCCPLHHLVNNAGIIDYVPLLDVTEQLLNRTMSINFNAVFNTSQIFAKQVIKNGIKDATIVNISGVVSIIGCPIAASYAASKSASDSLTKNFAVELAPHGIRVNSVAPAAMRTAMMENLSPEVMQQCQKVFSRKPMPGGVQTEDAAHLIMYLSSTLAKMITGQFVPIDGGTTIA